MADLKSPQPAGAVAASEAAPALRDVLVMNYESLTRRLVHRLGCPDLASDCLHDAWLRLGELTITPAIRAPDAYVFRVACNLAMDRLRSERGAQPLAEDLLEEMADVQPGPEAAAEARSDLEVVEAAFRRLPPRHRTVLLALRIDERTREEVAERLQMSLRSVDTTLRQALQHCAAPAGRPIAAGSARPRRELPGRWWRKAGGVTYPYAERA